VFAQLLVHTCPLLLCYGLLETLFLDRGMVQLFEIL